MDLRNIIIFVLLISGVIVFLVTFAGDVLSKQGLLSGILVKINYVSANSSMEEYSFSSSQEYQEGRVTLEHNVNVTTKVKNTENTEPYPMKRLLWLKASENEIPLVTVISAHRILSFGNRSKEELAMVTVLKRNQDDLLEGMKHPIYCEYDHNITIRASRVEKFRSQSKAWVLMLINCNLPHTDVSTVTINGNYSLGKFKVSTIPIPPPTIPGPKPPTTLAICMAPMFGITIHQHLVEWIEYHILMGVNHFYAFDFDQEREIIKYYVEKGVMTVYDWKNARQYIGAWYNLQLHAMHVCLYQHREDHKYILFNDIDEYLLNNSSSVFSYWDIIRKWENMSSYDKYCNFNIKDWKFYYNFSNTIPDKETGNTTNHLLIQHASYRSAEGVDNRCYMAKTIVKPTEVVSFRNCHCVGYCQKDGSLPATYEVPPSEFRLQHYKRMHTYTNSNKKLVYEYTVGYLVPALNKRVSNVYNDLVARRST